MINRLCRRALIGLGLLLAALSTQVHAQSTPKTVTLVVPYAAGDGTDTVARLIGEAACSPTCGTIQKPHLLSNGARLSRG